MAPVEVAAPQPAVELAAIGPAPVTDSAGLPLSRPIFPSQNLRQLWLRRPKCRSSRRRMALQRRQSRQHRSSWRWSRVPASRPAASQGTHVVQLGAFNNVAVANDAWAKLSKRYGMLSNYNAAKRRSRSTGASSFAWRRPASEMPVRLRCLFADQGPGRRLLRAKCCRVSSCPHGSCFRSPGRLALKNHKARPEGRRV